MIEIVENFRNTFGDDAVDAAGPTRAHYARSTSLGTTEPLAVVYPRSTQNVRDVVHLCRQHQVAFHPISRGRNWGYGDASATSDGQVIVDLSRMNRIVEIDREFAFARIEPGVTQGQLHRYLREHDLPLWADMTGAGHEASFVGNFLERGFGHTRYGEHSRTGAGLQVVLGDGRVIETGLGRFDHARADHLYPQGVGPELDGLFAQSNFGIVTQMGLWLLPRPEAMTAFFVKVHNDQDLAPLLDRLTPLRRHGLIQANLHLGNDLRLLSSRMAYPWDRAEGKTPLPDPLRQALANEYDIAPWTAGGAITGTRETVAATKRVLRRRLKPYRVHFVDDRRLAQIRRLGPMLQKVPFLRRGSKNLLRQLAAIEPVYANLQGVPTDEPLRGAAWRVRPLGQIDAWPSEASVASEARGPDHAYQSAQAHPPVDPPVDPRDIHAGVMFISPVIPGQGAAARQLMDLITPIFAAHGFEPMVSFTMMNERAMIAICNVYFDTRVAEEAKAAGACREALTHAVIDHGFIPYRGGPTSYHHLIDPDSDYGKLTQQLKQTFDPDGLISPGRYVPES